MQKIHAKIHTLFKIAHKSDDETSTNLLSSEKEGTFHREHYLRRVENRNTGKKNSDENKQVVDYQ